MGCPLSWFPTISTSVSIWPASVHSCLIASQQPTTNGADGRRMNTFLSSSTEIPRYPWIWAGKSRAGYPLHLNDFPNFLPPTRQILAKASFCRSIVPPAAWAQGRLAPVWAQRQAYRVRAWKGMIEVRRERLELTLCRKTICSVMKTSWKKHVTKRRDGRSNRSRTSYLPWVCEAAQSVDRQPVETPGASKALISPNYNPTLTLTLLKYPYRNLNLTLIQKLKLSVKLDSYSDFRRLINFRLLVGFPTNAWLIGILTYRSLRRLRTQC